MVRSVFAMFLWLVLIAVTFSIPFWPYKTARAVELPFLNDISQSRAIVFFGFPNCTDVCPVSLSVLKAFLRNHHKSQPESQPAVVFVDIDENSSPLLAQQYASSYHSQFLGIHPDKAALAALKAQFGLNIRQTGSAIRHQGRTYFLEKRAQQWHLVETVNPTGLTNSWLQQKFET